MDKQHLIAVYETKTHFSSYVKSSFQISLSSFCENSNDKYFIVNMFFLRRIKIKW